MFSLCVEHLRGFAKRILHKGLSFVRHDGGLEYGIVWYGRAMVENTGVDAAVPTEFGVVENDAVGDEAVLADAGIGADYSRAQNGCGFGNDRTVHNHDRSVDSRRRVYGAIGGGPKGPDVVFFEHRQVERFSVGILKVFGHSRQIACVISEVADVLFQCDGS